MHKVVSVLGSKRYHRFLSDWADVMTSEKDQKMEASTDLFESMRFLLSSGRILGVLPLSRGLDREKQSVITFRPGSSAYIYSACISVILLVNFVFGLIDTVHLPKRNAYEIAKSVGASVQFSWGCFIYLTFLTRGKQFLNLFHVWSRIKTHFNALDTHLYRDVVIITALIMTSGILENATLHLEYLSALDPISGRFSNDTIGRNMLETLYIRSNYHWYRVLGFHEVLAVVAFIQHKYMLYGWNFMDVIIASFSRAIYFKFKVLYEMATENVHKKGTLAWNQLAEDHKKLCDMLQVFENFFSPLVFGSCAVNIFYICIQLLEGLVVDGYVDSLIHSVYAPWSFLHLIMRLFILYICAARINTFAHKISKVVRECPAHLYTPEIARLEDAVNIGPQIGLSGLGCFIVNKPFILKILSVVFTIEIVLLQGVPSGQPVSKSKC